MAKSNYHLHIKGMRGGRRKQFDRNNETNRVWLRSRKRVRTRLLGR